MKMQTPSSLISCAMQQKHISTFFFMTPLVAKVPMAGEIDIAPSAHSLLLHTLQKSIQVKGLLILFIIP
jgi:hypothetical protein